MARLALFLLGPPRLERDGETLHFDTYKILALVAYLAVSDLEAKGQRTSRDSVIALLWPELEPRRSRAVLRRNLSLLRKALAGEWLAVDGQLLSADPQADFWLDVEEFRRLARVGEEHSHAQEQVCPECLEALAEAVSLYRGDFLEGFGLRDSVAYDDWQFFQAQELREALSSILERLVQGHGDRGDFEAALPYARRRLALDPLHEPAHQQLMRLYALAGQRAAALRQYEECVRMLHDELGLPPDSGTTALYQEIRTGSVLEQPPSAEPPLALPTGSPARAPLPRHNLPAQTTPFVGREEELAEIGDRMLDPACRLLTLLGPGGIGKTRLALRLAQKVAEEKPEPFEHGVFFVPLASVDTVEGLVAAVAEAVGYCCHSEGEGNPQTTLRQQLLDYLSGRQLLLLMDNYEQLLVEAMDHGDGGARSQHGSVAFLSDVMAAAPRVKLLVTSRASLGLRGEHLFHVAGLQVPEATLTAPRDVERTWREYSAIQLFVQAAQQVRPDLLLSPQDLIHVAHICSLVQGTPLGILLAAAWAEMLAPREIAAEVERSLDFLATNLRDVPSRQRSIRAAMDHSWGLLDKREQELFQGLSVFRGSFTRQAALQVTGATLQDLLSLAHKSLLHPSSAGRYEIHELLRQYGAERLAADARENDIVRNRHCAYYTAALERWGQELRGARQRSAAAEMDMEVDNARSAWHWAVEHKQTTRLAQAADGLWLYHARRLRYSEGETAFRTAAATLEQIDGPEARRLRAKCLFLRSHFLLDMGKRQLAEAAAAEGQVLLQELAQTGHDVSREGAIEVSLRARIAHYYHPDPLEARRSYEQSALLYERVGDRWGQARALASLGRLDEHVGDFAQARELCQKSLNMRQELGDQQGMADSMVNLGVISWVQGHLDEADHFLRESVGIFRSLDDWSGVARAIKSMGEVLVRRGLFADGLALMESSADIYQDLGYKFGAGALLPFLGEAKLHLGRYDEACADAQWGEVLALRSKHRWGVGFSQFVSGLAALAQGKNEAALAFLQESLAAFEDVRHRENQGWVLGPLGLAARATGNEDLARESVQEALRVGVDLGTFMPVMYALPTAALLLVDRGAPDRAVEVYASVSRHSFVADSRWFDELARCQIEAVSLSQGVLEQAQKRGRGLEWADAALCAEGLLRSADA